MIQMVLENIKNIWLYDYNRISIFLFNLRAEKYFFLVYNELFLKSADFFYSQKLSRKIIRYNSFDLVN